MHKSILHGSESVTMGRRMWGAPKNVPDSLDRPSLYYCVRRGWGNLVGFCNLCWNACRAKQIALCVIVNDASVIYSSVLIASGIEEDCFRIEKYIQQESCIWLLYPARVIAAFVCSLCWCYLYYTPCNQCVG